MITPVSPSDLLRVIQEIQNAQNTQSALSTAASALTRTLPADIFNLAPGNTINATITQADAKGLLTLTTDAGSFQLRLSVPQTLSAGSTLTLQLTQIGDQSTQFRLVALDGQPVTALQTQGTQLPNAVAAQNNPQAGGQVQTQAAATQVQAPAAQPSGIQATVIAPADPAQAQQSTLQESWQPGTQLAVRIVAVTPPAASQAMVAQAGSVGAQSAAITNPMNAPAAIPQAAATQTAGAVAAPATGTESQGARDATLQFGLNTPGRQPMPQAAQPAPQVAPSPWMSTSRDTWAPYSPTLFMPPEEPGLSTAPPATPQLLTGTVAPNTSNGHPIVSTPAGLLAVETQPMPAGTKLTLEVVGKPVPPAALKGADGSQSATPYANSAMPAMEEAIDAVKISDPMGAQRLIAALPTLSPRMAANMVAYIGAVRQGDIKNWLGEGGMSAIESRGGRELVKRIEGEFKELTEIAARPRATSSGTWSTYMVPMMNGHQIEAIQLNVRRAIDDVGEEGGQGGKKEKGGGTRFVVDLNLSRLGPMQIDGLVRGGNKKIDFIIRTPTALPSTMRFDLNQIVTSVAQASGLEGTIVFQANTRFVDTPKIEFPKKNKPGVLA